MKSEPVFEVSDYFDGPRAGIASFNGRYHHFKSRHLDTTEYKGDYESVDIFELTPVDAPKGSQPLLATAEFHVVPGQEDIPKGTLRKLTVVWHLIE